MKKFFAYLCSFALCLTVLTGCNLIELNKSKYYSQVVVSVEYKDNTATKNFTMEDLLQAYNNYGYQYIQNGSTPEEALNSTAELMVQRYMLVEKIKQEITLTDAEKNALKRETYKHINTNLAELESEIRVEWDRVNNEPEASTEESEPLRDAYTVYEPTIERVYDENGMNPTLKRVVDEEEIDTTPAGEFVQNITDADVSAEAMKRYVKQLKDNAEDIGKKVKESDLLNNEINRIYGILEENKYISKYQTQLTNNLEIKSQAVVDAYKQKYLRDYEKFNNNLSDYHSAMASDSSAVYYHPYVGTEYEYMNVTHILFSFSDEQKAEIEALKKQLDANDIEQKVYDERYKEITSLDRTVIKYEENGEVKTTNGTLAFEDIKAGVTRFSAENNFENRARAFNDYIYKYNDDPGIMNKEFSYVVNLDTNVTDQMVKEFADEARALFKAGLGEMSAAPVKTEHGYHVLLNLGPVKNVVEYRNINNLNWQTLYNVKTQPSSEKTLFHYEYDSAKLDENAVTTYINNTIADLTATAKVINYYKSRYLSLLDQK